MTPYAMLHDTIMVTRRREIGRRPRGGGVEMIVRGPPTGAAGVGLAGEALRRALTRGSFNFVPRPDWYFYFLFSSDLDWLDSVVLGTVGVPNMIVLAS